MKRRLTPFLIGISVILIGTLAYAADRRKQEKHGNKPVDDVHEEEALRAELLDAVEGQDKKTADVRIAEKGTNTRTDDTTYHGKSVK
jgi:hypothetical protein